MRVKGWRQSLENAIAAHRGRALEWGVHDCLILAGDAVLAVMGEDPIPEYRGAYSSEKEGFKLLRAQHGDFGGALAARFPEIPISRAVAGDVALVPVDGLWGMALGVVIGDSIQVFGPGGLGTVPLVGGGNETRRAFKIG